MIKKSYRFGLILLAAACLLGATACSQQEQAGSSGAASVQSGTPAGAASGDENTIYGEVTAVDGDKITIDVGTLNQPDRQRPESGDGSAPQERRSESRGGTFSSPEAGLQSGERSRERRGGASGAGSGSRQGGFGGLDRLKTTGESRTITIADPGVLSFRQSGGALGDGSSGAAQSASSSPAAALSDIRVGTILQIEYQDDEQTLSSVVILGDAPGGSDASSGS